MASLLNSQASFEERARDCGLSQAEVDVLVSKGLTSLSTFAFSATTPGTTPGEDALRNLLSSADPASVPLHVVAALRRSMFESQTLAIAQLKSSIELDGEKKSELAPSERHARIQNQRKKLAGLDLTGPLENAYSNYTYVSTVVDQDYLSYLEPHRFITRAMEVSREKPGKELILDEHSRVSIRDRNHKEKCGIQNELQLAEALTRRALACDLMQLCSFEKMDRWHKHLLAQLSLHPPPHYSRVSMEQLLRTDRAAFVRMAELLGSLKVDPAGKLPLDMALDNLQTDPRVMISLAPLPGPSLKKGDGKKNPNSGNQSSGKRDSSGNPKKGDSKGAGKSRVLEGLSDPALKHNCSKTNKRLCWNFNTKSGCKSCRRGLHLCMSCEGAHSLLQCPTYRNNE